MAFQFIRTKKMRLIPERLNQQLIAHVKRMGLDPAKIHGLIDWDKESLKRQHVKQRAEERRVGKECVSRVDLGGRRIIKKKKKRRRIDRRHRKTNKEKHT